MKKVKKILRNIMFFKSLESWRKLGWVQFLIQIWFARDGLFCPNFIISSLGHCFIFQVILLWLIQSMPDECTFPLVLKLIILQHGHILHCIWIVYIVYTCANDYRSIWLVQCPEKNDCTKRLIVKSCACSDLHLSILFLFNQKRILIYKVKDIRKFSELPPSYPFH